MNKLQALLATTLAVAATFASAQPAATYEGGLAATVIQADAALLAGVPADRATVAAEGREAARHVDSRSGLQSDAERGLDADFTSSLRRADVRAEAIASLRDAGTQDFEGGEAAGGY